MNDFESGMNAICLGLDMALILIPGAVLAVFLVFGASNLIQRLRKR